MWPAAGASVPARGREREWRRRRGLYAGDRAWLWPVRGSVEWPSSGVLNPLGSHTPDPGGSRRQRPTAPSRGAARR